MTSPQPSAPSTGAPPPATPSDAAHALSADVFYVSGPLYADTLEFLRMARAKALGRDRCVLVLTTDGGDAHDAYRMARLLRRTYESLVVCVFGYCKSAGTLLALGGHEIVLGDRGELGPLDVQIRRDDELFRYGSGLEIFMSLDLLTQHAFRGFEQYFLEMVRRSGGSITTRTAAEMATDLTVGIMKPICAQVDPLRLGLERRALEIAVGYAARLGVAPSAIARLTDGYPDHSFVIDRHEAGRFLDNVRAPNANEKNLEGTLRSTTKGLYTPSHKPVVRCLNPRPASPTSNTSNTSESEENDTSTEHQ